MCGAGGVSVAGVEEVCGGCVEGVGLFGGDGRVVVGGGGGGVFKKRERWRGVSVC